MPLSDDFGFEDDDTEFLAAATQVEASQNAGFAASPRPTKRRRIRKGPPQLDGASSDDLEWSGSDEEHSPPQVASKHFGGPAASRRSSPPEQDENEEPEEDPDYYFPGENGGSEEAVIKQSKYKIHIPKNGGILPDLYLTQTQRDLDDDPTAIRGAIWKKPRKPEPPLFNAVSDVSGKVTSDGVSARGPANKPLAQANGLDAFVQLQRPSRPPDPIEDDAAMAKRLQAEEDAQARQHQMNGASKVSNTTRQTMDFSQDLADLPEDAFSSSSPEKSPSKEVIEISPQVTASQRPNIGFRGPQAGLKQMTIFGQAATQQMTASQAAKKKHAWPLKAREEPPSHHLLNEEAMKTWVYPTNLGTIRDYQFNIVSRSLFHNTLVALPTGLGKTFIAATVMLNYYRWTKDAQIIFMAPTKPLIAQQMEACYGIAGIHRQDTVLMTGETQPPVRAEEWLEGRVFFMTPQTVINDLKTGICDPKKIVLVVVDEAHKATGSYAYTEVIAFLRRFNTSFRVLALTATPGSTVEAVQAVIDHLGIARVELRTEQSLDIRQYTHEKHTETELFDWSDEQQLIMELMSKALKPVLDKLNSQNAYWSKDPMQLTAYGLQQARGKWMSSDAGRKAPMGIKGMVNTIFTVLSQLAHAIGLLKFHGIAPFFNSVLDFQKNLESGQAKSKYGTQIIQHEDWVKAMGFMRSWSNNPDFIGHPKLQYLREVVLNHFMDASEGRHGVDAPPSKTRIMVFASYRDSTQEICRVLKRNEPMIRPHEFVGQAASKGSEGMNQKRQNEVIQDFKAGKYNTLVATSIGEEGLDIGDVDLIVCYDASASPIRMLQRIGRTGRKRIGRVQLLLMRGKEENDYAKAQDNYSYIQKTIADVNKYSYRDDQSPRILPKQAQPVVDKRMIDIPPENSQPVDLNEKNKKRKGKGKVKKPPKKFHMPDNVRTGFVSARKLGSDEEDGEDEALPPAKAAKKKAPVKAKKPPPSPEPEPAQLPFLEDVLLNDVQARELDRKYRNPGSSVANAEVSGPDVNRFPRALQTLGGSRYIGHGRAARAVSKAIQAIQDVDEDRVERMKSVFDAAILKDATGLRARLVNPEPSAADSDAELPHLPPVTTNAAPKAKKPRGRPRKQQALQRTASYGSAAMEGEESEPEPTPANMRIGTQGIDLGSHDTSGEDNEDEHDSELDDFVVKSDQPIETVSSSLPASQELRPAARRGRKLRAKGKARLNTVDESEDDETPRAASKTIDVDEDDDDESVHNLESSPAAAANRPRKRLVVEESDDDGL